MSKVGVNELCPCGSKIKFKKCHRNKIYSFRSESFTVAVNYNGKKYKIFKITFHHPKGTDNASLIVSFPYHKNSKGLLSLVTFPKNQIKKAKISLIPGGKVTSNKIKYSHWKDGNVHFSQDGKILTFKKTASDVLEKGIGHIFTVHLKGLKGFEEKLDTDKPKHKELQVDFNIPSADGNDSVKLTGWWYEYNTVHTNGNQFDKSYIFKQDDGPENFCLALQPPIESPLSDKILFLCIRKEFMTKEKGTHLLFIGGLDKKVISNDITKDLQFLAMSYPARNYNKLITQIGSVDLNL